MTDDIEEIANKIAKREQFRLRDAATRYKGDREGFVGWMVNFFDEHEKYCIKKFLDISIEASEYFTRRTPDARLKMLEVFDTGTDYSVKQTAADIMADIVELKYGHDKPQRLSN